VTWGLNSRSPPSARKALGSSSKTHTTVYVCEVCGSEHVQWIGRCPTCREWNSVRAFKVRREPGNTYSIPLHIPSGGRLREVRPTLGGGAGTAQNDHSLLPPSYFRSDTANGWVPPDLSGYGMPSRLTDVNTDECQRRMAMPGQEFSRVLGGGLVPGSVVMVGGDPGVGKSTLLLQLAGKMAAVQRRVYKRNFQPFSLVEAAVKHPQSSLDRSVISSRASEAAAPEPGPVVYVSGEESTAQVASRAMRLGIREPDLYILCETDIEAVVANMQPRPALLVVDSIQTMRCAELPSSPGSVAQVKECAAQFVQLAKGSGVAVMLVGHVTKSGDIAGPRTVEHMVDAVLYLEGDRLNAYRLLRSVKNRFGSSNEVGVFEMSSNGLSEVANPSRLFMSTVHSAMADKEALLDGTAVMVAVEGTRPLICELQALVTYSRHPSPRRTA
ncbi:unnamed protein product, partial [Phaeothamnion confervicola]